MEVADIMFNRNYTGQVADDETYIHDIFTSLRRAELQIL